MKVICILFGVLFTTALARAEDVTSMISQYRRAHGLQAVKTDAQLSGVAERQARAMARSGMMDHSVAGTFATRIAAVPVSVAGENLAEGTKTWAETIRLWESSAGHNANLLLPGATHVGAAVAHDDRTHKAFWAMEIGRKVATPRFQPTRFYP